MSLDKDLTIDIERLDSEWISLPSTYYLYREEADYLDIKLRKLKIKLDFSVAELDGKVRLDPKQYFGVDKTTETQIRSYIESNENILAIKEEMLEVEKKKKLLSSACEALEMKRDALKNLVVLMNGEYFSTKSVKIDFNDVVAKNNEESKRNIRREMRDRLNKNN